MLPVSFVCLWVAVISGCAIEPESPAPSRELELLKVSIDEIARGSASREPQVSQSSAKSTDSPLGAVVPPPGAKSYTAETIDMKEVRVASVRSKRTRPKRASELGDAPQARLTEARPQLQFSSGVYRPEAGIDPRLLEAVAATSGRSHTYGFIYLDEYLSPETEKELAALGLEILGPHSSAYKARIPRNARALRQAIDLDYVQWIGFPEPDQKLSRGLKAARDRYTKELDRFPVVINLFEPEASKLAAELLPRQGIVLGRFDSDINAFTAVVPNDQLNRLADYDFILFIELDEIGGGHHDESMSVMGIDYIRTGGGGTNFDGSTTILGIMDSGFMVGSAAATAHVDLNKYGCGINFTSDAAGVWNDQHDHGTHVLGTIIGTGSAEARNRGTATGIGNSASRRIRAAKTMDSTNSFASSWVRNGFDYMDDASSCNSSRPHVINFSGGTNAVGGNGSGSLSRKLDAKTWDHRQLYVISAGNSGSGSATVGSPGDAKNALTVGNVLDQGLQTIGDIRTSSSRGPTGDGRMKPNLVATGTNIRSANAGTTNGYRLMTGTSMAAPHVAGIAATLRQHYASFENRPHLLRAHLMASSILHDDDTTPANNSSGGRNTYGLGRVSTYVAHWARPGPNGWSGHWAARTITNNSWGFRDISVPSGTDRLVVVMTWDEDSASSGASEAVSYDLDLWVDRNADCTPDSKGQCGEWASQSWDDNVEYLIINNPPAGTYRLKIINWHAPSSGLPAALSATVIRGDPTPAMNFSATASTPTPALNTSFTITTQVGASAYVASGVHIEISSLPSGVVFDNVSITREDGINMQFTDDEFSLGNIVQGDTRTAQWTFRATTAGSKSIRFRIWSENGGTVDRTVTVTPS